MGRPRNRKKQPKHTPRFVAPFGKTPALTFGDVLFLLQAPTWFPVRSGRPLLAAQRALAAAMAACARIDFGDAVCIHFAEALTGRLTLTTRGGDERPVFLLPAVVKLVENLTELRPTDADPGLFVSTNGRRLIREDLEVAMGAMGRRWGFHGSSLMKRLFDYFDGCFADENDRFAVAALSRLDTDYQRPLPKRAIEEAAKDEEKLLDVLNGHVLAGPAGRWIGARGVVAGEETMRLFRFRKKIRSGKSEALSTDPVCIRLAQTEWPAKMQTKFRKELADEHFDHTEELYRTGKLSSADQAFLFHTTITWVRKRRRDLANAKLTDSQSAETAKWLADLPTLYLARPRGEGVGAFWNRVRKLAPPHMVCTRIGIAGALHRAGLLNRRRRRPAIPPGAPRDAPNVGI